MKSRRAILLLSIISLINLVPLLFSSDAWNVDPVDIYPFYDHARYLENIAYDVSEIFSISILTYIVWLLIPYKAYKRYAMCFLIISLLGIPAYFLFYSQYVSLIFVPLLISMLVLTYRRNGNEERNNAR
jgi:hypothetical protein